ncbi:MAG: hypothetical protein JWN86_3892 [Planctomycetota bacterium]|nr:hypothetical protein [Planctomycetota bacterium]
MNGRSFLVPAQELSVGSTEAHWRASAGRSYYALFQEALAALQRWGIAIPPRENIHAFVRLRFLYSTDAEVKDIGKAVEFLVSLRNEADYKLATAQRFRSSTESLRAVSLSRWAISRLDQIESDPDRLAEVIASIRP